MAQFSTAPVPDVIAERKQRKPSQRAQIRKQYQEALRGANDQGQALIVRMDPEDKALTVRNRIKRAAEQLEIDDIIIRRRKDLIVAYPASVAEQAG